MYGAAIVALNPISYWRLGEAGGPAIVDERAVQNGTYVGAIEYSVAPIVERSGGGAIGFNGTDAYGQIPDNPAFALASYTIDFAFQADAAPAPGANMVLLSKDRFPSPPDGGLSIEVFNDAGQLKLRGYAGGLSAAPGWIGDPNGVADIRLNRGYKVTVTVSGAGAKLYLDGEEKASAANTQGWQSNGEPIVLGAYSADALAKFDGVLDDVAIFDRALTPDEISTLGDSRTIQHQSSSSVSLTAPLEIFTPAEIQVTALAGWPAGRSPKAITAQGARAYGYVRRSWKATRNDGTWMNFWPGWQPGATEGIEVILDDDSGLTISVEVQATIPSPTGSGVTRYLDASAAGGGDGTAGAPWNSWASAIAGLGSGDVLVVRARSGTRSLSGRQIPNYVYPVDVGGSGTVTSTANNVTIYADPTDLAAGRRPRIHINGTDLAGFFDDPNGMWEPDPSDGAGNVWRTTRSTYTQTDSQNIWWRGSTGRICGGYAYFNKNQSSYLNQLRDTTYPKSDMYGGRTQTYVGPGITFSNGRYYVRLSPPPLSTIVEGARTTTPWYWTDYYPPGTNPNTVPLYVSTANDGTTTQSCLTINGTIGWKIYNLDFVCGHFGIRADNTSGFQVWGCQFIGASQGDHPDTDNGNSAQGKQIRLLGATNFLADRCAFFGGCPPWFTWSEGKGWNGSHATGLRNGPYDFLNITGVSRHCRFESFFSMLLFNDQKEMRWHHCDWLNIGPGEGSLVVNAPSDILEVIRCRVMNCTLAGWAGSHANPGIYHFVNNFWSIYLPGGASHKALHTFAGSGGPPSSLDCDFYPPPAEQPHGGTGGGEPSQFRFQNSIIGTQRHRQASIGGGFGTGAMLAPHRPNQQVSFNHFWRAQNNIAAVYPSKNGYLWESSDGAVNAKDSFVTPLVTHALFTYNFNHYYRHPSMPSTGRATLAAVTVYNSGSGTNCANIAAIKAQGIEANGTEGDPGWNVAYPDTHSDSQFYDKANFLLPVGNTAASGGNTGLSGQGAHDYDGNTQITYPGYSWRGCFVPGVPTIEQEVGPLGPMIT